MLQIGDLIKNKQGIIAEVTRDAYTHRFMEAQDREMEAHGMGHMAGVYTTAYDIRIISGQDLGLEARVRGRDLHRTWTKVLLGPPEVA
jgi:hypothetical protein